MNSRQKGKRIELEAAHLLRDMGFADACRGAQHSGSPDSPDVKGVPGWHIEVKGCERLNLDAAVSQAMRDAGPLDWMVLHKKNRGEWRVTLDAKKFLAILGAIRRNTASDKPVLYPEIVTIVGVVSEETGVSLSDIMEVNRSDKATDARYLCYWLAFTLSDYKTPDLAQQFGITEDNVVEGAKWVMERRKDDVNYKLQTTAIHQQVCNLLSKTA